MPSELKRNEMGIKYIRGVSFVELMRVVDNSFPVCGECLISLTGGDIVIIPLLDEAYCSKCAIEKLSDVFLHPEDSSIQDRRVRYYVHMLARDF